MERLSRRPVGLRGGRAGPRAAPMAAAGLVLLAGGHARADALFLSVGRGGDSTLTGFGVQLDRRAPLRQSSAWRTSVHLEIMAASLVGEQQGLRNQPIGALALTPNVRWTRIASPLWPFLELGLGLRTLTRTSTPYDTRFSTNFQFGEFAGLGFRLTAGRGLEISVRAEHISNGGIREPNAGITFLSGHLGWVYRPY